ncbi:MAG: YdiU family protein [Verrucomicrobia bacterium]|nr:YdiU family protein [Verrucomicrobiota bacterium]MCH8525733.1 YdiU family protein [Kiritimatiellia bacterium]
MPKSLNSDCFFEHTYSELPEVFFEACVPVPVADPVCVVWNDALGKTLGVESWAEDAHIWSGNRLPGNARPLAQAYAGHQFGGFTMLGDGRAHLLGETVLTDGSRVDLQLKGSGRTVFSRGGDGRAVLEPMLREYLISEAMHALGIPTTRSLAVVRTGETVHRERPLPGAVLTRVAASHLRVGTFQYAAGCGEPEALPALIRYALARHSPQTADAETPALELLRFVVAAQAGLIAQWMLAGFVHGVMNTDNMAVSGETIDYGPCAFMDRYDPETVFSSIDREGRYAYGNQPSIALWNLSRFAETLLTELHPAEAKAIEMAEGVLKTFEGLFHGHWLKGMRAKLGLFTEEEADEVLIGELLESMHRNQADYTRTFAELDPEGTNAFFDVSWYAKWRERLARQPLPPEAVLERMRGANPRVIPRNHLVEAALNAAGESDMAPFKELLAVLREPFSQKEVSEKYLQGPPTAFPPYVTYCGT